MSSKSGEIVARPESPEIGRYAAAALVFGASAGVLVVEIVALRLLAPYLGLTLETSTLVIGVALAAIAMGAWAGRRARRPRPAAPSARPPPRRLRGRRRPDPVRRPPGRGYPSRPTPLMLVATLYDHRPGHAARRGHPDGHQAAPDQPHRDRHRGREGSQRCGTAAPSSAPW